MPFYGLKPLVQPEMIGLPQDGTGKSMGKSGVSKVMELPKKSSSMGPCGISRCKLHGF